jgi:hypothetical protein
MILSGFDFMDGFLSLQNYVGGTLSSHAVLLRGGVAELGSRYTVVIVGERNIAKVVSCMHFYFLCAFIPYSACTVFSSLAFSSIIIKLGVVPYPCFPCFLEMGPF